MGDFDAYAQLMSISTTKQKDFVFTFGGSVINNFTGMELLDDSSVFVRGVGVSDAGYNNNYVSLLRFGSVSWEKNVFSAANPYDNFDGDASVFRNENDAFLYVTTTSGVKKFNSSGVITDSFSVDGTISKKVQRTSDRVLVTKITNSQLFLLNYTPDGRLIDSLFIIGGAMFVQGRYYESTTKSLFLTVVMSGTKNAIIKISSNQVIWKYVFLNTSRSWVVADEDRVYVVSAAFTENYRYRTKLYSYSHDGNLLWEKTYIPTVTIDSSSVAKCITIYPKGGGCTISGGSGSESNTYQGTFIVSYNPSGDLIWEKIIPEYGRCPLAIAWNSKKELIIGGSDYSKCYISSYFVDGITGVNDHEPMTIPSAFILHQNYPNPFNPSTTISYDLPVSTQVQLVVYDNIGQKVVELVNGFKNSGNHKVVFNGSGVASGVYFIRFAAGTTVLTKKMLLIK